MAVEAGLDPEQFWRLTPWQTRVAVRARHAAMLTLAWHVAALERQTKLPELASLLGPVEAAAKREAELMDFMAGVGKLKKR